MYSFEEGEHWCIGVDFEVSLSSLSLSLSLARRPFSRVRRNAMPCSMYNAMQCNW